jgi:hypothetical protein
VQHHRWLGHSTGSAITAGHIDAVTRAPKQLSDTQRSELFDRVDQLADVADICLSGRYDPLNGVKPRARLDHASYVRALKKAKVCD